MSEVRDADLRIRGCNDCGWTEYAFDNGEWVLHDGECPDCGEPTVLYMPVGIAEVAA